MRKTIIFLILFLFIILINGSIISWNILNQDPFQVYSLSSVYTYPSVLLDNSGLKQEILFDYYSNTNFYGSLQGEYGKIGVFIIYDKDTLLNNLIFDILSKNIEPVKLGILLAKKNDKMGFGIRLLGYNLTNSYIDLNSISNTVDEKLMTMEINPSVSLYISQKIIIEMSPNIIIRDCQYEDYNIINKVEDKISYQISGRIINFINNNTIIVYANYSSKPYSYSETSKSTDLSENYLVKNDSLKIGLLTQFEEFNYIKSYFGINFEKIDLSTNIEYSNGSIVEEKYNRAVLPSINSGLKFYINDNFEFNAGIAASWIKENNKSGLLLIEQTNSSFDLNYNFGFDLLYNDLKIDFGFSKNIIQIPYFITGEALNNIEIQFGISYSGFEF